MPMSQRSKMWLVVVGVALASAAIAGAAVWYSQQARIDELEREAAANKKAVADLTAQVDDLEAQLARAEATPAAPEEPTGTPTSKPTVVEQFTFIKRVTRSAG